MSGPYIEGLGKRRRISEDSTSSAGNDDREDENFFFEDQPLHHQDLNKRRRVTPTDAELIPKFRPDNKTSHVSGWLHKIDQLGEVYGWDNKDRQFIMQLRLGGSARDWYNDLENYDLDWEEWKKALETAFPRSTDFVDKLELMLTRTKVDAETMTKYYHEKLSLLKKCDIDGEKAISCIIRGLPHELRANAKAYKCDTPEELYYGYLSSLENFKRVEAAYTARRSTWRRGDQITARQQLPKICYSCRRPGHEARDCRASQRCEACHRPGHTAATCWFSAGSSRPGAVKVSNINVISYDIYLNIYKKNVIVNRCPLVAYIDTGSKINVLTLLNAENLKLDIIPSRTVMKGFGGACTPSLGTCDISVHIDNIVLEGNVELTDCDLSDIDLIIGQTMINQQNISMVTTATSVNFIPTHFLTNIHLDALDFIEKFPVCLKYDTIVSKQSYAFVEVFIDSNCNISEQGRTFMTRAVWFELGGLSYFIPQSIIDSKQCHLKVINVGQEDILWSANKLIARAEFVSMGKDDIQSNVLLINKFNQDICEIKLPDIDVGNLTETELKQLLEILNKFPHSFARDTKELGCTNLISMRIHTSTDQPVYSKPYRLSHKENEIVNDKVKDLLDAGIIRESVSDYASPVVLVRKKGGDFRLCVDYRALNARTIKDRHPLPHIEDQVTKLAGKAFFTTLDLAQGYYQVPIHVESISKTAFVTPSGQFEFLKMPFGLANAPAVFSRLIQMTLGKVSKDIALYLDDVMIPTIAVDDGLKLLEQVLTLLKEANLKLNLKKNAPSLRTQLHIWVTKFPLVQSSQVRRKLTV